MNTEGAGIRFHYFDAHGREHERKWEFRGDVDEGGVLVIALDDNDVEFDRVKLRREGAFIVHELPAGVRVPESFEFLRPLIEARHRANLIGFTGDWPPVLVHSAHVRRIFELGFTPGITKPMTCGKAEFFGVRVVWDEALDYMVQYV